MHVSPLFRRVTGHAQTGKGNSEFSCQVTEQALGLWDITGAPKPASQNHSPP